MAISTKRQRMLDKHEAKNTEKFWKLYEELFGEPPPKGWKIEWRVDGRVNLDTRTIFLAAWDLKEDLETAIHEMLHVCHPKFPHGEKFDREVKVLLKKAKKNALAKG